MKRHTRETLLGQQAEAVPSGIRQWGLERFMFATGSDPYNPLHGATESFLAKEMGYKFIDAYFILIHPHMPILNRKVVEELWENLWETPRATRKVKWKEIIYMVLALGARTSAREGTHESDALDNWADYFWAKSNDLSFVFQEASLKGIHFLLLKVWEN